jgi:hypothetical protein
MSYLMNHPYLAESSVLALMAVVLLCCLPRFRGILLATGLIAVPFIFLSYYYIPHY